VVYYMITTVLAVILGIVLVTTIQPGVGHDGKESEQPSSSSRNVTTEDTLMDLVRNCFPPNIIQATIQQYRTMLIYPGPGGQQVRQLYECLQRVLSDGTFSVVGPVLHQ
jgi:hypothetical protein